MVWSIFPAEIVLHILSHSSPRDVVRWRAVSKWFRDITYDSTIWKTLYANSYLPRPPGPFAYQTPEYLERTLVRTEKLAQSWTTEPMRDTSRVELQVGEWVDGRIKLLCGRWVMWCELRFRFVLHDLDATTEPRARERRIISEQKKRIYSWDARAMTHEEGLVVLYVLLSEEAPWSPHWRLMEFRMNSESGELYDHGEFDVPWLEFGHTVELQGGNTPFLFIPGQCVVFDTRTGIFYGFPTFDVAREEMQQEMESRPDASQLGFMRVLLTNTHVIAFYGFHTPAQTYFTLIQAFVVPPDGSLPDSEKGHLYLSLSHEGIIDHYFDNVTLLRNSIVDPVTRVTTAKFFGQSAVYDRLQDGCGDLLLPESLGSNVSPIIVKMDEMIERDYELDGYTVGSRTFPCYIEDSEDGYLRGFYRQRDKQTTPDSDNADVSPILKFAVDATQEPSVVTFGQSLLPRWNHIQDPFGGEISFDGTRGQLCVGESRGVIVGLVWEVVVVDIQ